MLKLLCWTVMRGVDRSAHGPEVDQHKVQSSAKAELLAGERLSLKKHEQRHAPKCAALILQSHHNVTRGTSLLGKCKQEQL